jgi:hypothetical protein
MNPESDQIDRIANGLPAELRADYYREIRHCRSLPENDEMLRMSDAVFGGANRRGARAHGDGATLDRCS